MLQPRAVGTLLLLRLGLSLLLLLLLLLLPRVRLRRPLFLSLGRRLLGRLAVHGALNGRGRQRRVRSAQRLGLAARALRGRRKDGGDNEMEMNQRQETIIFTFFSEVVKK